MIHNGCLFLNNTQDLCRTLEPLDVRSEFSLLRVCIYWWSRLFKMSFLSRYSVFHNFRYCSSLYPSIYNRMHCGMKLTLPKPQEHTRGKRVYDLCCVCSNGY